MENSDCCEQCRRFDAFCKTVLRHEMLTFFGSLRRQQKREIFLSDLSASYMDNLSTKDEYPSDSYIFSAFGYVLLIRNERLAKAIMALPHRAQSIMVLRFSPTLNDTQIGRLLGLSRSSIQRHRTRTIQHLRRQLSIKENQ